MSKEAMKLALDYLDGLTRALKMDDTAHAYQVIAALREALAEQPAQDDPCPGCRKGAVCRTPECGRLKLPVDHPYRSKPPAQRTWVGLTDEEIDQGLLRSDYAFKTAEAWRAGVVFAMTKLKEKNT